MAARLRHIRSARSGQAVQGRRPLPGAGAVGGLPQGDIAAAGAAAGVRRGTRRRHRGGAGRDVRRMSVDSRESRVGSRTTGAEAAGGLSTTTTDLGLSTDYQRRVIIERV